MIDQPVERRRRKAIAMRAAEPDRDPRNASTVGASIRCPRGATSASRLTPHSQPEL